jgi:hypothetical protein
LNLNPYPTLCEAFEYTQLTEKGFLRQAFRSIRHGELPVYGLRFSGKWKRLSGGKTYFEEDTELRSFGRVEIRSEKTCGYRLEFVREPRAGLTPMAHLFLPAPKIIDCQLVQGGDFAYWESKGEIDLGSSSMSGWRDLRTTAGAVKKLWGEATASTIATASTRMEEPRQIEHQRQDAPTAVKSLAGRRTGRPAIKGPRVEREMRAAIESGEMTVGDLDTAVEKDLVSKFKASRKTCRAARNAVLNWAELVSPNSDAKNS